VSDGYAHDYLGVLWLLVCLLGTERARSVGREADGCIMSTFNLPACDVCEQDDAFEYHETFKIKDMQEKDGELVGSATLKCVHCNNKQRVEIVINAKPS